MQLLDIVRRQPIPEPWAEGDNIPWHEPGFSERMLREHLTQGHDAASRRFPRIDEHVAWIHNGVLGGVPTSILDLGCGPGLYANRLARLGHTCLGIDYSPASLAHARQQAEGEGLACRYVLQDIRHVAYGTGHGLAMLLYGEFNVFRHSDIERILRRVHGALADDGLLLLEPHTFEAVRLMGQEGRRWQSASAGLFSAQPHLCLEERFWDSSAHVATTRYIVVDAVTGDVSRYAQSMQAYTENAYRAMLAECGFGELTFYPSLTGKEDTSQPGLLAIVARKQKQPQARGARRGWESHER